MTSSDSTRWSIDTTTGGIVWNVADGENPANILPHADHVEMSGRRVCVILRYRVDKQRRLFIERDIFFPQLRVRENDVRGYLRCVYDDRLIQPRFLINGKEWIPSHTPIHQVTFDGVLTFHYMPTQEGILVTRSLFPCRETSAVMEHWSFLNTGENEASIANLTGKTLGSIASHNNFLSWYAEPCDTGESIPYGEGRAGNLTLATGDQKAHRFSFFVRSTQNSPMPCRSEDDQKMLRHDFVRRIQNDPAHIAFSCPDPELNQLFAFAKLRAAESLFETDLMGLVHSPGGGNYYCGIWANDQCEYSGPFFAFLNDSDANEAAVNAYRHYAKHMTPDFVPVPTSFEMGGHMPYHAGGDRGDAAMIASGLSRYLLVRGDRELATELYPALQWCNEFNQRKTDARGVVLSDTDELEGRFSTGDANLSTATLAYDGYRMGAHIARELGKDAESVEWDTRADALSVAIEAHFGATVEGFPSYRYYDGNDILRSWICLPLVFGLAEGARKTGTLDALFSPRLWTPDGLATQAGDTTFWDRSTLYGLRGAFIAGATEPAYEHLLSYSRRRLLGEHVPYPVEAYPENAQAHLSAESALYCRVFLEGLLGIVPTGFESFTITPRLPKAWNEYSLRFTAFGGRDIAIHVERKKEEVHLSVMVTDANGTYSYSRTGTDERTHTIDFRSSR